MTDGQRKPKAKLHKDVPTDVQEFVRCKRDSVEIAPRKLDLPGLPTIDIRLEDVGNGTVRVHIDAPGDFLDSHADVGVKDGELTTDTSNLGFGREAVDAWIEDFEADLKANGKRISEIKIKDGKLSLTKAKVAVSEETAVATPGGEPPPMPIPPPPAHVTDPIPGREPERTPAPADPPDHVTDPIPGREPAWTNEELDTWFEEEYGGDEALKELIGEAVAGDEVRHNADPALAPILDALLDQKPGGAEVVVMVFTPARVEMDWRRLSVEFKTNFRNFIESGRPAIASPVEEKSGPNWLLIGTGVGVVSLILGGFLIFGGGDPSPDDSSDTPGAASEQDNQDSSQDDPAEPAETETESDSVSYNANVGAMSVSVVLGADPQTGENLPYSLCATDPSSGDALADTEVYITIGNDPAGWLASHDNGVTDASGCITGELPVREDAGTTQLLVSDGAAVAPAGELIILEGTKPAIDMTDAMGDQQSDDSKQVAPGEGNPGGDIVGLSYTQESDGSHTFGIQLAGDGMQYAGPGNAWLDVIVETQDGAGGMWRANGAFFSGQYQDRGIKIGPPAPGQPDLEGGMVTVEFTAPDMLQMNVNGGGEPLDLTLFRASVGLSADGETFWDSALGAAGLP